MPALSVCFLVFAVSDCWSRRGHTFCMNRKYAKNHKRGGDCVFPAPFETPPMNRQRGTVRGSPLIPSEGGQDFKPVVKLITAKKVSQNHGFPSKGSCRRRRLMRWKCTVFACNTSAWYTLNTSSGSLREPPSPQGEGFSARQLLNTAPTPGGIKRGPGPPFGVAGEGSFK